VLFRAPKRIKGSKQKRLEDVLEGAKKCKKGKDTKYPTKESVFVPSAGTINPSIAMSFGESPSFLGPPIEGEFTRLLLEAHGDGTTPSVTHQLDFNDGASTSRFQP